jgi:hypothetical protein
VRRGALLALVLGLVALAGFRLQEETRYRLVSTRTVGELLAVDGGPSASLVLVFQPEDCLGEGTLVTEWNRAYRSARLPVRGVVVGTGAPSARQGALFRELRLEMPLAPITRRHASTVAERLGYTSTPFAILLDAEGRVAAAFPASGPIPPPLLERVAGTGERAADS